MKKITFTAIVFVLALIGARANDIQTIKKNYTQLILSDNKNEKDLIDILIKIPKETFFSDQMVVELMDKYPIQPQEVATLLSTLKADGTWSDINYTDANLSGWQPKKHIERILLMTKSFRTKSSTYYHSQELETAIHKALKYWFDTKPKSPNWWHNQIGVPKTMGAIAILFEDKLNAQEKIGVLGVMKDAKFGMTGQNKVWLAGNVLVRGLLENKTELVKSARDTIFSEITIGNAEGIKPDNSFHQHGAQLQFGNYGAAYISSMGFWSQAFAGTSMSLSQSQLNILSRLVNEGYARILWKGRMDINALGRQMFRLAQRHKGLSVGFTSTQLMNSDTENASKYRTLLDENFYRKSSPTNLTGLYHFWNSDVTVQRRPQWMASVKMSSLRVIGAEAGNGDNLKGYYLADGATYVYIDGDEYDNIFPSWEWRRIPGTTTYETDFRLKQLSWGGYHNNSSFAGNVNDGKTGITAMEFDRDGLKARKAWIFTDEFVLCLGSAIEADSGLVVTTSIEQRLMKSDLRMLNANRWETITKADFSTENENLRFFHDKTGYILLQPQSGKAAAQRITGLWKNVMNMYPADYTETKDVVSLWLDHGKDPKDATYQYLILPSTTASRVKNFDTSRIKVRRNNKQFQSVTIDNVTYVAAYPLANIEVIDGMQISSTNTGLFMISEEAGRTKMIVCDPTQSQTSMDITYKGATQTVQLPSGDLRGTPVTVYFD